MINILNILFYVIAFLLYFLPPLFLLVATTWFEKKPHIIILAVVNFFLISAIIFSIFSRASASGPGMTEIFMAFPFVEIALLVFLFPVIIGLKILSPFLSRHIPIWKNKLKLNKKYRLAEIILMLLPIITYIGLALLIYGFLNRE